MIATCLKTEYLSDPIGIDMPHPLLSWTVEGGKKQTAFRIQAESRKLSEPSGAEPTLWDSGKTETSSMRLNYAPGLSDRESVCWRVKVWDEEGKESEWSESGCFETGISSFTASWISGNYQPVKTKRYPVDCFRKNFEVEGEIASARLYCTALGVYEARINSEKCGDHYLAPGITDYNKRVQYQTMDVTDLLKNGDNEITLQLADGWYRGSVGAWGLRNEYGTQTKVMAQLEIVYTDGTMKTIVTDDTWNWSDDGPILEADNKDGEIVEAFKEPSYKGKAIITSHSIKPTASNNVPVTLHEEFKGVKFMTPSGKCVLDFGQNIAGILKFKVNAKKGDRIVMRFGELIDKEGEFTQKNIQCINKKKTTPLQRIIYICKDGLNEYQTTFAIFGFRYMEILSDVEVKEEDFTAVAVYSDIEETSRFECSNDLLTKFYAATLWSARNNHLDIPTDCPTRERHGWSGDAQIFTGTASYLYNYRSFARKYLLDLADTKHKNGKIGQIAPKGGVDRYMQPMDGCAGWSDAICLIPWRIYRQYGDKKILEEFYPVMKEYALFKRKTLGKWYPTALPTGIDPRYAMDISNYGQSYGEWAEPEDVRAFKVSDFISPHPEETTAYIVFLMDHMAKIAEVLHEEKDAKFYKKIAEKARRGYQHLVMTKKFSLDTDRQARLVRPLYMDLLTNKQKEYAEKRLLEALEHYRWRLGTGFLSTPFILDVLCKMDPAYAYRLLENEEVPGWLSMPKNGANTIWEAWEGPNSTKGGIASLNHYSKGAVMEWVFNTMCGIKVEGENHFAIAPVPGGSFTHASLTYKSIYGTVNSSWKKEESGEGEGVITYHITIPANCSADVCLQGKQMLLEAGEHTFTLATNEGT